MRNQRLASESTRTSSGSETPAANGQPRRRIIRRVVGALGALAVVLAGGVLASCGEDGPTAPAGVRALATGLLEIRLSEGCNRQVRRMCEAVGHRVVELRRVALGPLRLENLPEGDSRQLKPAEVERLRQAARQL